MHVCVRVWYLLSCCLVLQITDMLQVHPDRRPSAVDLVMVRLPPLMEQLIREEEEEEEPEANADERVQDSDASRRTRSAHCMTLVLEPIGLLR